ncbi:unnamed protein product [Rotaria sordida]|uniref:non-specific serine/threonine protein kinase n=1 Tax=Rotaria sordida TaxID=392033 RepID=A0A818PDU7_9BILA|nr:unnamed protein product [Rotaria sordida]
MIFLFRPCRKINVHKLFQHENIIQSYSYGQDDSTYYLFLEYVAGGELFKKIDLKPENILIAKNDILKICDFGLETVFRNQTVKDEQILTTYYDTRPYLSPEVYARIPYRGEPADVWSCELPWDQLSNEDIEYKRWLAGHEPYLDENIEEFLKEYSNGNLTSLNNINTINNNSNSSLTTPAFVPMSTSKTNHGSSISKKRKINSPTTVLNKRISSTPLIDSLQDAISSIATDEHQTSLINQQITTPISGQKVESLSAL